MGAGKARGSRQLFPGPAEPAEIAIAKVKQDTETTAMTTMVSCPPLKSALKSAAIPVTVPTP